jgi:MATE family multidrug resistance protein
MQLKTTYKQILSISAPIMLGSAAQNVIALSDSVFLYYKSESDFAAIGFVGVFYLVIAAIGYGLSKGGQILIARRMGERNFERVGITFYGLLYLELILATVMFLFMHFGAAYFFSLFLDTPEIYQKSLEFIHYRSYGIFFSYGGVALIALYTGIARTSFIIFDTVILGTVNILLCYAFVFGAWGFPEMGIGGAGLASTIAEAVAFVVFAVYMIFDKQNRVLHLLKPAVIELKLIRQLISIGTPAVAQAVVGLGSWFIFFSIIENLGQRELAITNLVRMVYLCLSIPCWGFASGINTLVSHFIGRNRHAVVMPIIWKTAKLCLLVTLIISIPVTFFPEQILAPILGRSGDYFLLLVNDAQPVFYVLALILIAFSIGGVYFNGLAGTGATMIGLVMQTFSAILYLGYLYFIINYMDGNLEWAWAGEIFYWILLIGLTVWFLKSKSWHTLRI